jgi:hypothetical protein
VAWHIFGRATIPKDLDEHAVISAIHEKYPDLQDEDRENVVIICQHYVECASHTFFLVMVQLLNQMPEDYRDQLQMFLGQLGAQRRGLSS